MRSPHVAAEIWQVSLVRYSHTESIAIFIVNKTSAHQAKVDLERKSDDVIYLYYEQ